MPTAERWKTLFHPDSYWRDALALSWTLQTINGRDAILKALTAQARRGRAGGLRDRPRPRARRER